MKLEDETIIEIIKKEVNTVPNKETSNVSTLWG